MFTLNQNTLQFLQLYILFADFVYYNKVMAFGQFIFLAKKTNRLIKTGFYIAFA